MYQIKPPIDEYLLHYGVKRRSGRYPWGSGDNPYQHSADFLARVDELKKSGLSDTEIAREIGLTTTQFRVQKQLASHERRQLEVDRAKSLRSDGKTLAEITQIMGYKNDSSVRALLDENTENRANAAKKTAEILKKELKKKNIIDVGVGVERELGISPQKLNEALYILELEGYQIHGVGVKQATNSNRQTNIKVLCNPDITQKYLYEHIGEIQSLTDYHSTDGGATYYKLEYPSSIDSKRIKICYGDEGGLNKDGVIEIRRGVADLDLGNSHYAQVRIMVDNTHYLKGMAMYSDNIPAGVDIVFNTNKKTGTAMTDVLKKIKDDPDNPFGANIKAGGQSWYTDSNGEKKLSAINKIKEEGDWDNMSRNLSSQFLSKQPIQLINRQLILTYTDKVDEFNEICKLNNPTIKRKMLEDFANECDAAAVHIKAAALPRQSTKVILPLTNIKETEVYAPTYRNGEQVALIRYPHGGTFEIPILTVNNKNSSGKAILGNVKDAIGINAKVAERLSGADFDGDQVIVIPTNSQVHIRTTSPLKGLEGFDPKDTYAYKEGIRVMKKSEVGKEMGMISNLITDMTLRGASESELARAVRHSMVVIDAEKHKLNYKQSEKDNGIAELRKNYQQRVTEDGEIKVGGASTLLSKRKQDIRVNERKGSAQIDPKTGKVSYKESGRLYPNSKGNLVPAQTKVKLISTIDDAYKLSSGTPQESAYADYINKVKSLANQARKEMMHTGKLTYSPSAKVTYMTEVESLNAKLNLASLNAPRERKAQIIANSQIKAKIQANPDITNKDLKKQKNIAINNARASVSANGGKTKIQITDKEWEAIQAGAISDSKLQQILRYADSDSLKQRATPKTSNELSTSKQSRISAMAASGYTIAEIASAIGCSPSTVSKYM